MVLFHSETRRHMIILCIPLTVAFVCFKVGEIHFKNSYVAYITVKAKCRITDSKDGKTPNFPQIFQTIYLSKIDLSHHPMIYYYWRKLICYTYSKICVKRPLKNRQNKDLNNNW